MKYDKKFAAIMGFIVGDAFGVPYEFSPRHCLIDENMIGYRSHVQPAGTWSDDTSMVIAELAAIDDYGIEKVKLTDIADNFIRWLYEGEFTPYGRVFDVGRQTSAALNNYYCTKSFPGYDATESTNGNGALMRILPFALFDRFDKNAIYLVSHITHSHEISKKACWIYTQIIRYLLTHDYSKDQFLGYIYAVDQDKLLDINVICQNSCKDIQSDGYVLHSLEAALWVIYNSLSYREAIHKAVDLGGDTDTIAAITGAMAGIIYGFSNIPIEWKSKLARLDDIIDLCARLFL